MAKKVIRLHYWGSSTAAEPTVTLLDNELRLGVGAKSFISIKENQISLSGGTPSVISIQGLSDSMKYAGMIQDLPFPLSIIPITAVNPMPQQIIVPPFLALLPTLTDAAQLATSLLV